MGYEIHTSQLYASKVSQLQTKTQQTDIKFMYSFKDLLNNVVKKEEEATNVEQSHAMISQREMTSFEAMDHQEVPRTTTSKNEANESNNLQISDVHGSPSQYFQEELTGIRIESKVVELPSRIGNGQQPYRNSTEAKKPVYEKMSYHQPPFPACQLDTLSGASEIMPLYQLASHNERALSPNSSFHEATSPLSNLDTLMVTAIGSAMGNAKTDTQPRVTYGGNRSQRFQKQTVANTLSCPNACPCVCHLPSPFPVLNGERPSVIMAPLARNYRTPSDTHAPLQDYNTDDSDEEAHFFRVTLDGLKTKFKLTDHDWGLMGVKHFPSGGRLLGGAWTSIFKRGIQKSNPWCDVRFKNNHVRTDNSRKINSAPFFRGAAECKREECDVKLKFIIKEEKGRCVNVLYKGDVCHKD